MVGDDRRDSALVGALLLGEQAVEGGLDLPRIAVFERPATPMLTRETVLKPR